jgi:RNA polymerase sigma-70 factor (ECF subfamily)
LAEPDATLVFRTLNGDKTAFGELYDRYARLVRAISYDSTQEVNRANDLTQEVFLRAYAKLSELKNADSFGSWLVGMARNVAREYRRGKFRDRHVLVGLEPEDPRQVEPSQSNQRLEHLDEAISRLSEQERMALHVYYLQGKDVEQAKKLLEISRSSLYRLLASGREKLEQYIREKEKFEE